MFKPPVAENRAVPRPSEKAVSSPPRWPWLSLIPIGLGAWAPVYAGVRARRLSWVLWGVVWSAFVVAGFLKDSLGGQSGHDSVAGVLLIVGWIGAIATSFVIRGSEEHDGSPLLAAAKGAEQRLADRRRALGIAAENPRLALEMGIGRPDVDGAFDAGLVDVNNAPGSALARLPGVDGALAQRIADVREHAGGFASLEDLGATLDLPGDLVEGLRDRVVFLPRG